MNWRDHIDQTPGIAGGKPVLKGTRFKVEILLKLLAAGTPTDELLKEYPALRSEHIAAALLFAAEVVRTHQLALVG